MLLKVSVLLVVWSVVRACDDVNTVACRQLDRVVNVCTDPCFSNMCQRYCAKCPLKCFHCVSTDQADCTEIVECPSIEYACVHERYLTNSFTVGHKRGCVHVQACSQLYGTACHSVGECRDHRGFCCKSDMCNRNATSQRTERDVHTQTGNIDQKRVLKRNISDDIVCHDVEPPSCDLIKNSNRTACSLSCFKKACPRSCGVCVECSSCIRVEFPEHCNTTTVCDPYEKCYTLKTRSTEGGYRFNLGCLHQKGCDTLQESLPHVIGRSDSIDITVQGHCCSGNLCNQVKPVKPVQPTERIHHAYGGAIGHFTWKDCVPSTTAYPYVTFTSLSVSPSPVVLPGDVTLGVQGNVHRHFGNDVRMVIHLDKQLLGQWTKVPCYKSYFGSCNLDNPCEFLSAFETSGTCPTQLASHGLPCTCPFNPSAINLPPSVFHVRHLDPAWLNLVIGRFRVRAEMVHEHAIVGCLEVELDIRRQMGSGGFLFK